MSLIAFRTALVLALALAACTPTFDWRDMRLPEADGAEALFPCRPERVTRPIRLAGDTVAFALVSCSTGGSTFAIGHAELPNAARVGGALQAMVDVAGANIGSAGVAGPAPHVSGAATEPAPRRVAWQARRPDGTSLHEDALFFARGRRVYQVSVVGTSTGGEVVDTFFGGVKLPP